MIKNSTTACLIPVHPHREWKQHNKHTGKGYQWTVFPHQHKDTVYACRSGHICDNNDPLSIIIHHLDETFANYCHLTQTFVQPGDWVEVGQPIGLGQNEVGIIFYYLDRDKTKGENSVSLNFYTWFRPPFISEPTPEVITRDMTKSQAKKWRKEHGY